MKDEKRFITCCLCGKPVEEERGNNPYPVDKNADHVCCDECNFNKVIPARIMRMTYLGSEEGEEYVRRFSD